MHPSENELRAYQDGELPEAEQERTAAHLAECGACQAALAGLAARAEQVSAALDALAPAPAEARRTASSAAAWRNSNKNYRRNHLCLNDLHDCGPYGLG